MKSSIRSVFLGKFSWRRVLRSLILIPVAVYLGLVLIAAVFADRLIFRPQPASYRDTEDIIKIRSGGEAISAKFYENNSARYTILFSHGNAEDIGTNDSFASRIRDLGFNVLSYDYRGYGTSGGSPSESNANEDLDAAFNYLVATKGIPPERIILHGRSLGGALAVDLASRQMVGGLIMESTFTSAYRVVTRYPVTPFDKFNSINKIGSVRCPVLMIHGTNDWTIPIYHAERLFETANEPRSAVWVDGAGHNNLFYTSQERYLDQLVEFEKQLISFQKSAM